MSHLSDNIRRKTAEQLSLEITGGSLKHAKLEKQKGKSPKNREVHTKGQIWMSLNIATLKDQEGKPKIKKPHWCIKVLEPYGIKLSNL